MRCPKCNTLMSDTHLMFIEECVKCGTCFDVYHDNEVEREWVYGDDNPDDYEDDEDDEELEALEKEAFGNHEDVWIEVDGHQQRVLGDPNMSEETKQALAEMIKAVQNGNFKKKE